VLAALAIPVTAATTAVSGAATGPTVSGFRVFTGYADCPAEPTGCSGSVITNPNYPKPWFGAKNVTFEADPDVVNPVDDADPDTSAIRIDDTGKTNLTIDDVSVIGCGATPLDLWGTAPYAYPYTVAPGTKIVFSSTNGDNFDGSDICSADPTVDVNIGGVTYSFADDIAENGNGGIHGTGSDETVPWSLIGGKKGLILCNPGTLPAGVVGTAYSRGVAAEGSNGAPTFTLTSGALPPGLALSTGPYSAEETISGTPTTVGLYQFTLGVTDAHGDTGSHVYELRVRR
jgi:hypothetical protein